MKNLNFTFKSIVQNKARWLLTLFAILTIGVGQMWGMTFGASTIYFDNTDANFTAPCLYIWSGDYNETWEMSKVSGSNCYWTYTRSSAFDGDGFLFKDKSTWTGQSSNITDSYNSSWWTNCYSKELGWKIVGPKSLSKTNTTTVEAGTGTSGDKFIVKAGTTITVSASGTKIDANHTVEYKFNSGSWSTTNTYTVVSSAAAATDYSVTVYVRTKRGDLTSREFNLGTFYYRGETKYNVKAVASPAAGGTVTPTSNTAMGQYTGGTITATKNTGYTFSGWTGGTGTYVDASATSTTFKPTAASTVTANFTAKTYDLTLKKNGGSSDGSVTATYNSSSLSSFSGASRTGYTCNGYYSAKTSGSKIINSDGTIPSSTVSNYLSSGKWVGDTVTVLWAQWSANTYTITLDKNNASASDGGSATATYDANAWDISTEPVYSGYTVEGYYLEDTYTTKIANADGTLIADVTDYTDGDGNWIYNDDVTVYTKWEVVAATYSLTFAAGSSPYHNGTVSATVGGVAATSGNSYNENSSVVVTAAPSTHYRVKGWYREAACTNAISGPGTDATYSFTLTKDTAVYVGFEQSTCTITLDRNGGTSGETSVTATHGSALPSFTAHALAGYTLQGYYTETSGGTKIINANGALVRNTTYGSDESTPKWNSDVRTLTLHAQWTENKVTLTPTVNYNGGATPATPYTATSANQIGVTTTSVLTASNPNAAHYTFSGWTLTNLTVTSGTASTDRTITVKIADPDGETPAAVANYTEVLTQSTYVLKGGTNITGDNWTTEHAMSKKSGASTSDIVYYKYNVTKTNAGVDNNTFSFKIIKKGATDTWYGLGSGDGEWWYYHDSGEQTLASGTTKNIQIIANAVGEYVVKLDYSNPSSLKVTIEFPSQFLRGSWDWSTDLPFDKDGYVRKELAANTTYTFGVQYKGSFYKKTSTINATTYDQTFSTDDSNCTLETTTAGYYVFGWNGTTKQVSVIFPADTTKCKLIKDEYIYFDTRGLASTSGGWNEAAFSTRFWLKNYASAVDYGYEDCRLVDTVETGVYWVQIPAENLGQMQIERYKPDYSEKWCTADKLYAIDRTSTTYNCLTKETGKENYCNSWKPQWSTTSYCPPMKTAVVADNGTSNHGGNGSKATPYLIEKGATIKVTAASSEAFNDDANMTPKYHFYDGATSKSDQTGATYQFTASSTVNDIHKVVVMPYNTYNGQSSTKRIKSDTLYYKVVQHYTVTYNGNSNHGGDVPTDATHYITGENATVLDNSGSLAKEGYTFNGWKDGSEVSHSVGSTITIGTSDVTLYAQWADDHNYYFHGGTSGTGTDWNTAANWTKGAVPNDIANNIYILRPVVIPAGTTIKAAAVDIVTSGTYTRPHSLGSVADCSGKLTIAATAELIINGALHTSAAPSFSPKDTTTAENLILESSASGNAGLTWGTANSSPGAAKVYFYSKSGGSKNSNTSINQFVGAPFTSATNHWVYNYYNSWLLGADYSGSAPAWKLLGGSDPMDPFKGYCLIYNGSAGNTYEMSGTLITNADQTISLQYKNATHSHNENVLANSWTAPIKITALTAADFTNAEATIYIFNSGSDNDTPGSAAIDATGAAQWITIPVNSGSWGGKTPTVQVIPSMQSFSVYSTATNAKLTLDYSHVVYDQAANGTAGIVANRAPKRETEEETPEEVAPVVMHLFVNGESGYGDAVWMLEREDFTTGFDNGWDGHKIYGDAVAPQMFVVSSDGEMAVAAVPDFGGTVLGFKAGSEDNVYTFTFDYSEDETPLYLIDMNTQTCTRVVEGNEYIFSTTDTDAHNRFVLTHNAPSIATDIDNLGGEIVSDKAVKLIKDGRLFIIRDGGIYDALGTTVK